MAAPARPHTTNPEFMNHALSTFLALLMMILMGCAQDEVTPDEPMVGSDVYENVVEALEDTTEGAAVVDRLFEAYGGIDIQPYDTSGAHVWVDSLMGALTLDEKIGQLFIVHLETTGNGALRRESVQGVEAHHVGGFLVPRLLAPEQVVRHTDRLQRAANVPLFMAADYERGVGRFNNPFTELPSNMAIGATRDTVLAAAAGRLTAIEARALGVNLVFAPVVDVNNNPQNPIINIRSYGGEPELVGRMAAAFVREAESYGLMTTLKHFPGHGDTDVDSHSRMGVIQGDRASLERIELHPYRVVLDDRPHSTAVMSAHLWIEALEPDPLPATFSPRILTDLLREEMGFEGIVITDDIRMGALQTTYALQERILRPLEAGANVILTPASIEQAIRVVRDGIASGRLSRERIDSSVRRILRAKAAAGLHRNRLPDEERFGALSRQPLGSAIAQAIADRSITLLKTAPQLPLRPAEQAIRIVHLTNYQDAESIEAAMERLDGLLDVGESERYDEDPSPREIEGLVGQAKDVDLLVVALYLRLQAGRGEAGLLPRQTELVRELLALETAVVLVTYGNPYAASDFQEADAILVAYDQSLETIGASAGVLLGRQDAPGRLPIVVEPFAFGSGIDRVDERALPAE